MKESSIVYERNLFKIPERLKTVNSTFEGWMIKGSASLFYRT